MRESSYWHHLTQSRLSRRRALAGAATVGVGAAAIGIVGCGGDGDDGPLATGAAEVRDTTSDARPGGVYRIIQTQDPTNFDPHRSTSFTAQGVGAHVYSRLLKFRTGPNITPLSEVSGDAAESFEATNNAQTWTFKLRQNMKFQAKGPASISGRNLDSEDIRASYDYFLERNGSRATLQNLVDRLETPDRNTVVFHLKEPYAPFQELMASSALFWIISKQAAAGEVDTQRVEGVIGNGPWIMERAQPAVEIVWRKNPDWYERARISTGEVNLPILDGLTYLNMPDYAQQQSQFIANNIMAFAVRNTDLADVMRQRQDALRLDQRPNWLLSMYFFNLDNAQNPFRDERLRRALSMAIDRDGILEVFGDVSNLQGQGFDVPTGWNNSPIPWGDGGMFWWLDPESREMGDAGKWYEYNVQESRRLIQAAGYTGAPFDINTTNTIYGTTFDNQTEAQLPMLSAVGLNYQLRSTDYASHYFPTVYTRYEYPHAGYGYNTPFATVDEYVFRMLHTDGDQNKSRVKDSQIDNLIRRQRQETDMNRRQAIIHDIQKLSSDKMYYVPSVVGRWGGFTLYQPYVRNFGAFRTAAYGISVESYPRYWLDQG
jgi:peptide/nickel transport system substrate-binding protein